MAGSRALPFLLVLAALPAAFAAPAQPGVDDALARLDELVQLPPLPLEASAVFGVLEAVAAELESQATEAGHTGADAETVDGSGGDPAGQPVFSDPPALEAPVASVPDRPVSQVTLAAPASQSGEPAWVRPTASVAVTAGAGLALVALVRPRLLRWLVPVPLLTYTREALLENPMRARLLQAIEANPGVHFNQLVKDMSLGRGQAEHHLRALEKARLVTRHLAGGYACYFADPAAARDLKGVVNVLKADPARRALQHVLDNPGARPSDVARAQGMSADSALYHLRQLSQAQLVSVIVAGDRRLLYPTPAAGRALAALRTHPVAAEAEAPLLTA